MPGDQAPYQLACKLSASVCQLKETKSSWDSLASQRVKGVKPAGPVMCCRTFSLSEPIALDQGNR